MKKLLAVLVALCPVGVFGADDCATMRVVPDGEQSLQDVIELGLCRNPQTAAAYQSLQSFEIYILAIVIPSKTFFSITAFLRVVQSIPLVGIFEK